MKNSLYSLFVGILILTLLQSCGNTTKKKTIESLIVKKVDSSLFLKNNNLSIETVDCTLSDGTKTQCYQITTFGIPKDHEMGPWCPHNINDSKDKGGIWFKDGKIYDVDGDFIKELSNLYHDDFWKLYDNNGNVLKTNSKEDCIKLMGAQLKDEFVNFCIECLPEYINGLSKTYRIPITPVKLEKPINLSGGRPSGEKPKDPPPTKPKDGKSGKKQGPIKRGIAFNGVVFDAPAPLHIILKGYTIPPLDAAGGHINLDNGYHYHAATGKTKEHEQHDHHAPMIGYAMDGYGLYAQLDLEGNEPQDLDECRGHYDDIRGYHYHVDAAGNNNIISCFSGAIPK